MDLNSTSCTSDDLVFRIICDVRYCQAGLLKNGWIGGILFHDYNQGLSGYRSKWLEEGKSMALCWDWVTPNPNPTFRKVRMRDSARGGVRGEI